MLQKQVTQQPAVNTATVTPTVQNEDPAVILRNLRIATKNLIARITTLEAELKRVDSTQLSIKKMLKTVSENSEALNLAIEDKGNYSIYGLVENGKKIASFVLPNPKTGAAEVQDQLPDWMNNL